MNIRIRIVEDGVTRFFRESNEWLKVDENVDWLLPRFVAVFITAGFVAVFLNALFL